MASWLPTLDARGPARPPALLVAGPESPHLLVAGLRERLRRLAPCAGVEDPGPCLRAALDQGATLVAGGTGDPRTGWRPGLLLDLPPTAPLLAALPPARTLLLLLRRRQGDATLPAWVPRPHLLRPLRPGADGL